MAEVARHLSLAELGERFRAAADARSARHVQAIWLLAKGHEVAEVASTTLPGCFAASSAAATASFF